jgi:pilus assembly protein CpaE
MTSVALSGERETFAAYVCDDVSAQMLATVANERGWSQDMVFKGGIAAGVRALGAMPVPEFLVVDISECADPRADMQALADVCDEGTIVLAIGALNDVSLYRDLINAGVHDYLVKPLANDLLRAAFDSVMEALSAPEDSEDEAPAGDGQNIVFVGIKGGAGASSLAANIAWLSAQNGTATSLLDLDLFFGTSAMQFDLEPGRGLIDALENPSRVDGLFLERAVVKPHEKLAVLCAEAPIGSVSAPAEGALSHLVEAMSENYQTVIVDVPRQMLALHSEILSAATDIVLVTDYSLTAARDCIRVKAHIKNTAPNAKLHLVADRIGQTPAEVEEKDFENSIEHGVEARIPYDVKAALAATQKGKIIADAAPSSKLTSAYKEVAILLNPNGEDAAQKGGSWLGKLLKK